MRKKFVFYIVPVLILACAIMFGPYLILQIQRWTARSIADLSIPVEEHIGQEESATEFFHGIALPAPDANINDIITKEYSDRQIYRIRNNVYPVQTYHQFGQYVMDAYEIMRDRSQAWNIDKLNAYYPVECIRKKETKSGTVFYAVYYRSTNRLLELIFDEDGDWDTSHFYDIRNKSEFDAIRVGDRYSDVHAINPGGNYYFYSKGVYPSRISKHYTAEGYMLIITYESWYGWNAEIIDFELALV